MSDVFDLYNARMSQSPSARDRYIIETKLAFEKRFKDNPSYKKNGVQIVGRGLIYPLLNNYKKNDNQTPILQIQTLISDNLFIGDVLIIDNEHWLCVNTQNYHDIYRTGTIQKCNFKLSYQNFTSDILEQWCLITDSYSEITSDGKVISTPLGKTVLLLPYSENTRRLHKDKRIMTETVFDANGKELGVVFKITGFDGKFKDFGENGRLLTLTIESDSYSESSDNISEMICNYIKPSDSPTPPAPEPTLLKCEIIGSSILKVGGSIRNYEAVFYQTDGITIDDTTIPNWQFICLPEHAQYYNITQNGNLMSIETLDNDEIIGDKVKLILTDTNQLYNTSEFIIEVVSQF